MVPRRASGRRRTAHAVLSDARAVRAPRDSPPVLVGVEVQAVLAAPQADVCAVGEELHRRAHAAASAPEADGGVVAIELARAGFSRAGRLQLLPAGAEEADGGECRFLAWQSVLLRWRAEGGEERRGEQVFVALRRLVLHWAPSELGRAGYFNEKEEGNAQVG